MIKNKVFLHVISLILIVLLSVGLLAGCSQVAEEGISDGDWTPSKDVVLIAPAGAGGGTDLFVRMLADALEKDAGVEASIAVENHSGGEQTIGMTHTIEQPADGHTLFAFSSTALVGPIVQGIPVSIPEDFDMIGVLYEEAEALYVHSDFRFDDVEAFIEWAKENPYETIIVGAGSGSRQEVAATYFAETAGFEFTYVPVDGGSEVLMQILGKHADMGTVNPSEANANVESGDMRPLVMLASERVNNPLHDAPTARELGYDVVLPQARAVAIVKGAPPEVREYWIDKFRMLGESAKLQEYAETGMLSSVFLMGDDADSFIEEQVRIYTEVIESLGLK